MQKPEKLWTPDLQRIAESRLSAFAGFVAEKTGQNFDTYEAFHAWSCKTGGEFWDLIWDFAGVVGEKGDVVVEDEHKMPGARYFPQSRLNYAENLMRFCDEREVLAFRAEDKVARGVSGTELKALVSKFQKAFKRHGLEKGDRVAAMLPNMPEAVAAMLAATSLGAIWSSCSPDFGVKGVLDRFGQIEPKVFLGCDGYWYNGKTIEIEEKLNEIVPALGCDLNVIVPLLGSADEVASSVGAVSMTEILKPHEASEPEILRVPFDHPLYIMFSSGTTGVPKCIVHSHGGPLLKMLSEDILSGGIGEGDCVFYFTTCGWMMWNWLVTVMATGAKICLFDGSPFAPGNDVLFDFAQEQQFTFFGMSAKYVDAVRNAGLEPIKTHDLSSVRMIATTGSPLANENFRFVYSGIKEDVHLASMSGGTDIMGCFVGGVAWQPVYVGEIQGASPGMDVQVWDDDGNAITSGKGELVCAHAFPSMPVGFWKDDNGEKYHQAYFDRYDNVWCHGDFAEWTETGGMIIHGRSDATLNPGGVRIGTAEIYNQVEQMPEIAEALCIGQQWESDVRVVLFVILAAGVSLDEALQAAIKQKIRVGASPRHVPAKIVAVTDIPRTKSGKITELAVRDIVHGREVKNKEALANPEALELYKDLQELQG